MAVDVAREKLWCHVSHVYMCVRVSTRVCVCEHMYAHVHMCVRVCVINEKAPFPGLILSYVMKVMLGHFNL